MRPRADPGPPPHCCAAEPKPQGEQAAGTQRAPRGPFQTPSLLGCTRLGRDILIPELFFFKFQFSCISMRCVNVSGIISLASSQHTSGRDAQQHHALGIHRRRVTSPEKGRVPTHTGRTARASSVLRSDAHVSQLLSASARLTLGLGRCRLSQGRWRNPGEALGGAAQTRYEGRVEPRRSSALWGPQLQGKAQPKISAWILKKEVYSSARASFLIPSARFFTR